MKIKVFPSELIGEAVPPASKSVAHRVLISNFLSGGNCRLIGDLNVGDIEVTNNCLTALKDGMKRIDVCESGSSLRFLIPIICALGLSVEIVSSKRLSNRPIGGLLEVLSCNGATFSANSTPLITGGSLNCGVYEVDGSVSSQYITGLMLALPILDGDSRIIISNGVVSADYLTITECVLKDFGIKIENTSTGYFIFGNQKYISPDSYFVEGDWSSACFLLALGAACGEVAAKGVNVLSSQGDKLIVDLLRMSGAEIVINGNSVKALKRSLKAIEFDAEGCPDIVPVMCAVLANAKGISKIFNVKRLAIKESDRLTETLKMLAAFGIEASYDKVLDAIVIVGGRAKGCIYDSPNDHRMAMAAAVLASSAKGESIITGAECVNKSYPTFFEHLAQIGGKIDVSF